MRKLLHHLFGWDYVGTRYYGVFRIRVNDEGVAYVMFRNGPLQLDASAYKAYQFFFLHDMEMDYFSVAELEEIHGAAYR